MFIGSNLRYNTFILKRKIINFEKKFFSNNKKCLCIFNFMLPMNKKNIQNKSEKLIILTYRYNLKNLVLGLVSAI